MVNTPKITTTTSRVSPSSALKSALAIALLGAALAAGACNTVSGAGKDLQDASDGTKRAITGESQGK